MRSWARFSSRSRVIVWALLPALLLRVLTPVGFMPMHDAHGDLYLAFCPGIGDTTLPPTSIDDPHRGHHAMHDHASHDAAHAGEAGHDHGSPHHDLCPYALSAGPALAYDIADLPASAPPLPAARTADHRTVVLPTIDRAQSARAPPAPRIA